MREQIKLGTIYHEHLVEFLKVVGDSTAKNLSFVYNDGNFDMFLSVQKVNLTTEEPKTVYYIS